MNWSIKKISEVCKIIAGQAPPSRFYNHEEIGRPFLRVNSFGDLYPKVNTWTTQCLKESRKEDILLSVAGSLGFVNFGINACITRSIFALRPKKSLIDGKFLFYFLKLHESTLREKGTGSAQKIITITQVGNLEIPVPSIKEQGSIVKIIEELFAKIDAAQKLRGESQKAVSALLQSSLNEIFSGPKSKKWEEKELKEVCQKTEQGHPRKFFKDSFHYIDISSINNLEKTIESFSTFTSNQAPSRARKLIKAEDILFATTRPYLENIAFVVPKFNNKMCSTGFCVIRANNRLVLPKLLFFIITSRKFIDEVLIFQRGATYPAVSDKDIFNIRITLPPIKEQKKIVAHLDSLSEKVRKLQDLQQQTADDFKNLKKSILSQAFSGKLR